MIAFAPHNPVPDVQSAKQKTSAAKKENQLSIFRRPVIHLEILVFSDSRLKNSGIMILLLCP